MELLPPQILAEIKQEDFYIIKSEMDNIAKEMESKGTGYITLPHIGVFKTGIVMEGLLIADSLSVACNPSYVPTGKKTNTIETFLSDGKNYICNRFKTITAIFYCFELSGKLSKITKNLSGEKAIAYQHCVDYLMGKLSGHLLEEETQNS